MATIDQVRALAEKTYRELRGKVFGPGAPPPAELEVLDINDSNAGYSHPQNKIRIPVPKGSLEDHDALDVNAWPVWKSDLVHEMVHEYQCKVVRGAATQEGRELCQKYGVLYPGKEHDESFFTAAPVFADVLGQPLKDFLEEIAPWPFQ